MEWISVKEKTPKDIYLYHEPSPDVLVAYPWGIKIGKMFNCGVWLDDWLYNIEDVTHWMPLPKPPKE